MASNQKMEAGPTHGLPSQNASYHQSGRGSNLGLLLVLGSGQYLQLCCRELCSHTARMHDAGTFLLPDKRRFDTRNMCDFFILFDVLGYLCWSEIWNGDQGGSQRSFSKEEDTKNRFQFFSEFMISVGDAKLGELSPKAKHSNFIASNTFGACSIARELRQCVSSKQEDVQGRQNHWPMA